MIRAAMRVVWPPIPLLSEFSSVGMRRARKSTSVDLSWVGSGALGSSMLHNMSQVSLTCMANLGK